MTSRNFERRSIELSGTTADLYTNCRTDGDIQYEHFRYIVEVHINNEIGLCCQTSPPSNFILYTFQVFRVEEARI